MNPNISRIGLNLTRNILTRGSTLTNGAVRTRAYKATEHGAQRAGEVNLECIKRMLKTRLFLSQLDLKEDKVL